MKPANQSVEALFKLAGDTADLMLASPQPTRIAQVSQSLHNQLDIPERAGTHSAQPVPASLSLEKSRASLSSNVGQSSTDPSIAAQSSSARAVSLSETPVKKKRGRPPKVRHQENPEPTKPSVTLASTVPEVVIAHRSQHGLPTKRVNLIHTMQPEATTDKASGTRSTRLAADGISYRQLAGTREYRKRGESESVDENHSHQHSSSGIHKRKYKTKEKYPDAGHHKKHSKSSFESDPEQRVKRKYVKKSSKWRSLSQSSQLREENFLRAPNHEGTIRPTATRYDASRTHAYAPPHLEGAYPGISMPSMLPHDSHMAHMGMPPPGHLPGYPMHPFMVPQYMHMHHPYAFGRYDYGVPPSITSMYAPRDVGDPYFVPHSSMPGPHPFAHQARASQMEDSEYLIGHQHPAAPIPRVSAAAFRQHSSVRTSPAKVSNPIPDLSNDQSSTNDHRQVAAVAGNADRSSLKRNSRMAHDGRAAPFVELAVPDQPANAIALLPPLTETSAFRHISKSHEEVTAQRRRRHKLEKLVSGKPVLATSENGNMLSLPSVSLVNSESDLYNLRQLAPCSCKWTRSSYEQVLAQADALMLTTIVQGKSYPCTQVDGTELPSSASLASCLSEPAANSAVSFALNLQQQDRAPEVVKEFISTTLMLLKRELGSLNQAISSYSQSSECFHQSFENQWKKALNDLNARTPIPEEFFARLHPEANASTGEAVARDHSKVLWELFHQRMSDIVVAKNGLDVVMEGMKSIHKMGKSLPGVHSQQGDTQERK